MPRFSIKMTGNKALLKHLDKVSEKAKQKISDEIEPSAYEIHNGAVNRVPVDTGFLKNSITVQAKGMEARIEAGVKYAPYVEFGTGGLVNVPAGLEEYAMQFKGKGVKEVNLPPQPFLFPAFESERPKLVDNITKVLKDELK